MKSILKASALVLTGMLFSATLLSAQEHNHKNMSNKSDNNQMMDSKKIDVNNDGVIYECPMKCEPASDEPGECSKCGMNLKKTSVKKANNDMMKAHSKMMKKDKKASCDDSKKSSCCGDKKVKNNGTNNKVMCNTEIDKNKDGYVYECPMQCEPASDKPGECSKCGMNLKKVSAK